MIYITKIETPLQKFSSELKVTVRGWVVGQKLPSSVQLSHGNVSVEPKLQERQDVRRAFPDQVSTGFIGNFDFTNQTPIGKSIILKVDGEEYDEIFLDLKVIEGERSKWISAKNEKIKIISKIMQCSLCGCDVELSKSVDFKCRSCNEVYSNNAGCVDMLTSELRKEFNLIETDNVSGHPYPNQAKSLFQEIKDQGGLILDVGAGNQRYIDPSIICTEIVGYPSTDVLCAAQKLPFRDAVFDAVYSNAVLEHVTDPFTCAEEMMRVLKPGGRLFCSVPFLQPEHGYPHHYYNMTQDGLANLFVRCGATLDAQAVPDWGHPLITIHWMMNTYLQNLPKLDREKIEQMSVLDFQKLKRNHTEPIFSNLSEDGRRILACANYALFTKV